MARLIMFSDYLSANDKGHILESLEYIATREGVELNSDESHSNKKYETAVLPEAAAAHQVSKAQQKLIKSLIEKHPDLVETAEYEDFTRNENMYTSSVFITESFRTLEEMTLSNERYMKYISERPGVEVNEQTHHGLFDQFGDADLSMYYDQLANHQGNVWRDIISLTRIDAEEVDYNHQEAWRSLLQEQMHIKASELGIPLENFRWCASFHDESYHPHVHVMCWDQTASAGFQTKENIANFKSNLANKVFENEMWLHKELKYEARQDLEENYRKVIDDYIRDISKAMNETENEQMQSSLFKLPEQLNDYGSKSYAYQTSVVKERVNNIVANILQKKEVRPLLMEYASSQEQLTAYYKKNTSDVKANFIEKLIHPSQKDRKVLHNTVLKAAHEIKNATRVHQLQMGSQLVSLNHKLHEQHVPKDNVDQEKLAVAIVKLGIIQEKDATQILKEVEPIIKDEDKALEVYLDAKENSELKTSELKLVNKAYSEQLLPKLTHTYDTYKASMAHASAKMMQGFLAFMGTSAIENEREARRMNAVRRRDEMMMKRANRKQ